MLERSDYALRNDRVICNVVLFSTYVLVAAAAVLLTVSFVVGSASQTYGKLLVCGIAFLYIITANLLLRLSYRRIVAYMLAIFYMALASGIVWYWGINIPIGGLMFALAIVLAGILLNARHSLLAALASSIILAGLQAAMDLGIYSPVSQWTDNGSCFGDVLAYSVVFGALAATSWLYNREMERSLAQAHRAETALLGQKAALRAQVKKRTAELHQAQLKETQQMYRFAELGQLGVTLLHDLANHLSALSLEIDGLRNTEHAKAVARAQRITQYLGDLIHKTRDRLNGATEERTFDIIRTVNEIIDFMNDKAEKANVTIDWHPPSESWQYTGDATSLSQVVAILVSNAIDSYSHSTSHNRLVTITIERNKTHITIRICNFGQKITNSRKKLLFKPFRTSKKTGMGLGLFIARQMIEMQFSGTLALSPRADRTEFIITLPSTHET